MNRRDFLKRVGLGSVSLTLGMSAGLGGQTARRPNILVIMSDEHNAGVLGCYGNRIIQTPHLDRLAAAGTVFQNCYCNSPLCVPSRLAFTSGKYVSRVGAWNNACWLPSADYPSLPGIMNAAGYESILCGKMHYDATCRYGFREIGGNMNNDVKTGRGNRRPADDLTPTPGLSPRFEEFHAGDSSSILNHDRKVTAATVEFLQNRRAGEKPFFLLVGYLAPHFPLTVPQEYWDRYKGKVPMPTIPAGHLESLPRNYKHLRLGFNVEDAPEDVVRKGRELYYGLTQWLDDEIGKVLGSLAGSAAADNTVVIYTTDHGENMGEHGLWWKNALYEHAARVPLIVSWPARWQGGQRRLGACSLVDAVQTIAAIGGAKVPADWNGDSMVKWLDDPQTRWKDLAVSEYYAHNIASGYAMIRQGRFKYVYHTPADATHPAERELYDLQADPGEFHNLASAPDQKGRVEKMHAALVREIGEEPDRTEQRCRADYQRGYQRPGQKPKKRAS
ncbi:MAG: sulfatase-like hydrolase/transferase [Planctomycetes bacterium]|jgi:choline-sulfatase|nr:sulfatase-like hydrolase/transferase [Planctomycetota bacterium]